MEVNKMASKRQKICLTTEKITVMTTDKNLIVRIEYFFLF